VAVLATLDYVLGAWPLLTGTFGATIDPFGSPARGQPHNIDRLRAERGTGLDRLANEPADPAYSHQLLSPLRSHDRFLRRSNPLVALSATHPHDLPGGAAQGTFLCANGDSQGRLPRGNAERGRADLLMATTVNAKVVQIHDEAPGRSLISEQESPGVRCRPVFLRPFG